MTSDEERIAAIRAMTPPELNTYVAMNLGEIKRTQEDCNRGCQARLIIMEAQVETAQKQTQDVQKDVARLSGWMRGVWLIIGGMVAGLIGLLLAFKK